MLDQLHRGLVDLAVIAAPYDMEHPEGVRGGQRALGGHDLPGPSTGVSAGGAEIPLASLVGQPLIVPRRRPRVEAIHQWFGGIGAESDILCEMSNYMDAVALAEQNVGIRIFPQTTYTPNAHVVSKLITQPVKQVEYVPIREREQKFQFPEKIDDL